MSETKQKTFFEDLLNAQKEIEAVDKDGKNPFFKSDYTTLNATIESCKKALNNNNILVLQPIESDENGVFVCTTLIHTSGEKLSSKMHIREAKANDPQAQGSAITYARRYSLKSMLCMSDNDDDGEKAQQTYRKAPVQPTAQQKPTSNLTMPCPIHKVDMVEKISPKTGNPYFSHRLEDNTLCFGGRK